MYIIMPLLYIIHFHFQHNNLLQTIYIYIYINIIFLYIIVYLVYRGFNVSFYQGGTGVPCPTPCPPFSVSAVTFVVISPL